MTLSARAPAPRPLARAETDPRLAPAGTRPTTSSASQPPSLPRAALDDERAHSVMSGWLPETIPLRTGLKSEAAWQRIRNGFSLGASSLSHFPSQSSAPDALLSRSLRLDGRHGQGGRGRLGVARARLVARLRRHRCVPLSLSTSLSAILTLAPPCRCARGARRAASRRRQPVEDGREQRQLEGGLAGRAR